MDNKIVEILIELIKQVGAVAVVVIPAVLGLIVSHNKSHKTVEDKVDGINLRLETLYVDRIEAMYEKYSAKGFCPVTAKRALETLYDECHKNGWNGEVTFMRDELIKLPSSRQ